MWGLAPKLYSAGDVRGASRVACQHQNGLDRPHLLVASEAWRSARVWWSNRQSRRAPRAKAADDIGGALEPELLEGRSRQRRREAFIAEDDPGYFVVDGFRNAGFAAGEEAPLEVIALDDNGAGDLAVAASLELGSNVDESCTLADGFECGAGRHARES